ncbi:cytochrome P450 6a9-like [Neodiprion lecontei]|uniref:Cytochrome P450 6a9-like n=1 Tax=Neodiprion lecontei TaxID=441921 RepID=A0ABM3GA29_NEOLC|nr:cytochrome P450 6a9-like [Neodiprion lecontei]
MTPFYVISRDSEYLPDLKTFEPQKFIDNAKYRRLPSVCIPFGERTVQQTKSREIWRHLGTPFAEIVHRRSRPTLGHNDEEFRLLDQPWNADKSGRGSALPACSHARREDVEGSEGKVDPLLECVKDLEKYLDSLARRNEPFESREVSDKFTTDVIGSCVFGIQMNSLGDEDAAFRKMGRKIVEATFRSRIALLIQGSSPWLFKKLKLSLTPPDVEEFFIKITKEAFDYREKNNVQRHDFTDLLRKLRNVDQPNGEDEIVFDDGLLTAQAFVFFGAGFERSSTSIEDALHELAVNQDIQDRLREKLHEMKAANNGELTWDGLQSMKFLGMVFQDTN